MERDPKKCIPASALLEEGCSHSGFVLKEGGRFMNNNKQPRYFILQEGCLYYFKDFTSQKELDAFCILGYRVDEENKSEKFGISLVCPGKKTFNFSVSTEEEKNTWVSKLNKEIARISGDGSDSTDGAEAEQYDYAYQKMTVAPEEQQNNYEETDSIENFKPPRTNRQIPVDLSAVNSANAQGHRPVLPFRDTKPVNPGIGTASSTLPRAGDGLKKKNLAYGGPYSPHRIPANNYTAPPVPDPATKKAPPIPNPDTKPVRLPAAPKGPIGIKPTLNQKPPGNQIPFGERRAAIEERPPFNQKQLASQKPAVNQKPQVHQKPLLPMKTSHGNPIKRSEVMKLAGKIQQSYEINNITTRPRDSDDTHTSSDTDSEGYLDLEGEGVDPTRPRGVHRPRPIGGSFKREDQDEFYEKPLTITSDDSDDSLLPKSVFQDNMSREGAEDILSSVNRNGMYLIRKGRTGRQVITVFIEDGCRHYQIFTKDGTMFLKETEPVFKTLPDLIRHYLTYHLPTCPNSLTMPYS